jgi:Flp pilus assembly secretin CpaC
MPRQLAIICLLLLLGHGSPLPAQTPTPDQASAGGNETPEHRRLAELIAERDRLQREIDALSQSLQSSEQIVVRLEVIEVNLTALRNRGIDILSDQVVFRSGFDGERMQSFLKEIRKRGVSKTLTRPNLVTTNGRPASFFVDSPLKDGAAVDSAKGNDHDEVGQRVDVLPVALGNNIVKLDMRAKVSTGGPKPNDVKVKTLDTSLEMPFGQTWVLCGPVSTEVVTKRGALGRVSELQDFVLMVIVTPEFQPATTAQLSAPEVAPVLR